ncbi:MAG TPA: zinc ribbon domain-containing protein [Pyrinomonadaceae bacterium]|nr:zinc ribbon domain-containing protein [Pyrinomonadaceae bacterium]
MYCSACGKSISDNLNYCNNCGARNEKNPLVVGNSSSRLIGISAPIVGVIGLVGFVEILKTLLNSRLETPAVVIILLAYLGIVFLMFAVLLGHIWKRSGDIRIKSHDREEGYKVSDGFRGVNTAQLEEPRQPASVTDRTTKILENVPVERR